MNFAQVQAFEKRPKADLLVLPFWKGKKEAEPAAAFNSFKGKINDPIEEGDFIGKEGEVLILYVSGQPEKRVALLGLGTQDELTIEKLRRAYSQVTKLARSKKIKSINVVLPTLPSLEKEGIIRGAVEGLLLVNYAFNELKYDALKESPEVLLEKIAVVGLDKNGLAIANKYAAVCDSVYFVRNLVNGNADDVTPQRLAEEAKALQKYKTVKATIFDKKRIEKEKMGLLLAVNRGSALDPAFIILEYKGNPKSKDHTVVIGKGITYDTGGLNIKPTGGMETMKGDMAGAAVVLGTIRSAAELGLKVNVTGIIATTENSIGSKSYKPGDVYKSYSGKTVEIGNTDAEGRLVLADALSYATQKLKPSRIIDLATLTGAIEIALGNEAMGLFSNNDALADALIRASSETFERAWRLPLYEEYKDALKSDIADIKNVGGRPGGSITAAIFLQEFVGKEIPWVHLDIANTAYLNEAKRYNPKYGTGSGVRLLVQFLENMTA